MRCRSDLKSKEFPFPLTGDFFPGPYNPVKWNSGQQQSYKTSENLTNANRSDQLCSFLGFANCYEHYDFAKIVNWGNEHDEASKELKRMLFSAPILALSNFENNTPLFVLDTNVSCVALSGVLSQRRMNRTRHRLRQCQT